MYHRCFTVVYCRQWQLTHKGKRLIYIYIYTKDTNIRGKGLQKRRGNSFSHLRYTRYVTIFYSRQRRLKYKETRLTKETNIREKRQIKETKLLFHSHLTFQRRVIIFFTEFYWKQRRLAVVYKEKRRT